MRFAFLNDLWCVTLGTLFVQIDGTVSNYAAGYSTLLQAIGAAEAFFNPPAPPP